MEYTWTNTGIYAAGSKIAPLVRACRADPRFCYFTYLPKGFTRETASSHHLAVVVHGTYRDAEGLKNLFADFADQTRTVILAPLFPCGIIDREDLHNYKFIKYKDIRFDDILLDMVEDVQTAFGLTEKKFLLHGFSGGGQFSHRMFYLHPECLLGVSIGAPGRATYLDESENWYNGVKDFEQQFGKKVDYDALKKVPTLLMVGSEDLERIDYSDASSVYENIPARRGNRVERIRALRDNYIAHGIETELVEVPGAAHEEGKMLERVKMFFAETLKKQNPTNC